MRSPFQTLIETRDRRGPLIGVVAGSGLVAKAAVEGGTDLLFALNAGLYRSHGWGSFAGFLPFGNANVETETLLREHILPHRGQLPVVAGVLGIDPTCSMEERLGRLRRLGVDGVINWPASGFLDGHFGAALAAEGFNTDAEIALLVQAKAYGFSTFGFVVGEAGRVAQFAEAGVDALILGLGLTHDVPGARERHDRLQHSSMVINSMLAKVRRTGRSPVCLAFGGPITSPEDLEHVLAHTAIDGFAGGSVFERLPLQNTITSLIRRFKGLPVRDGEASHTSGFGAMVGTCDIMRELYRRVERVAPFDVNVAIEGESGSGKELVATQIHRLSLRRDRAFVTLNCGAIPDGLLESELFGHEKGAFTGAHRQRPGKFELAHCGTLFLDEIADLSPHGQVALLRAIQQREVIRVGGDTPRPVDVRILAASNRPLAQLVEHGNFRADLYFRLNGVTIAVPPLRNRLEDLPMLVGHVLGRVQVRLKRETLGVSPGFYARLCGYSWPGNVRELEHVLMQAAMLEDGMILEGRYFDPIGEPADNGLNRVDPRAARHDLLHLVLHQVGGNKSRAAELLGITRRTLYAWLRSADGPNATGRDEKRTG
jgi:DNA-binding NtrC family response regulator/predicted TIM-barrel enzyme